MMFAIIAAIGGLLTAAKLWTSLLRATYRKSKLKDTTDSLAFEKERYAKIISWDKYAFQLYQHPQFLLSGEFHYWRVPDRSRWEPILRQYVSAGLNTVRIYFHWGFHSQAQGRYNFSGNLDVDYLLTLCEKLRLRVLAAPGPYICAETQAGGFPVWLVRDRSIRIRHNASMARKVFDDRFAFFCGQWYEQIFRILAKHQVTAQGDGGCVVAVQIENELFEEFGGRYTYPMGITDDMKFLCRAARDASITVPLFTNDGYEAGSHIPRVSQFGVDLYGVDKYVTFVPTSSPLSHIIKRKIQKKDWPEWNTSSFARSIDGMESKIRGFGGGAATSPLLIPELQGGWFNHYGLDNTYDDNYNYYGENFTRLIFESALAQGVTASSLYMFYGGTNWGTLADPDVYTSYDYGACIRESGYMSGRLRQLRLSHLFVRSFAEHFIRTDIVSKDLEASESDILHVQRVSRNQSFSTGPVRFTFYRNFNKAKRTNFTVKIKDRGTRPNQISLKCRLAYKSSFIAIGNYTTLNGLHLLHSSMPIHLRTRIPHGNDRYSEIWIVEASSESDSIVQGEFAFRQEVSAKGGTLHVDVRPVISEADGRPRAHVVSLNGGVGWTALMGDGENRREDEALLYIFALNQHDIKTLSAVFEDQKFFDAADEQPPAFPTSVMWGSYDAFFNEAEKSIELRHLLAGSVPSPRPAFHFISASAPSMDFADAFEGSDLPFVHRHFSPFLDQHVSLAKDVESRRTTARFTNHLSRSVDFDCSSFCWQRVTFNGNYAVKSALDYGFTSGHAIYRTQFETVISHRPTKSSDLRLDINVRHRASLYLDGKPVGGHTTYSRQLGQAGAKTGPDFDRFGWKKYNLGEHIDGLDPKLHTLIIVVESFGLSRQAFIFNDVRNTRGIIGASLSGRCLDKTRPVEWSIAGVDVNHPSRSNISAYESSGFPDENIPLREDGPLVIDVALPPFAPAFPTWFQSTFLIPMLNDPNISIPLRLRITGEQRIFAFVNSTLIARYSGDDEGSPQHDFYLPDGLLLRNGEENHLRMLVYNIRDHQPWDVRIEPWTIASLDQNEDGPASIEECWSGNLADDKQSNVNFVLYKETLNFSICNSH